MTTEAAVINTADQSEGPSIQESYDQLVADGHINEDSPDDTSNPAATPKGERPAWLPEKFKTPEDMAKSYAEMEKKQGTDSDQSSVDDEGSDPGTGGDDAADADGSDDNSDAAADVAESAGLDYDVLAAEYAEAGELSEDAYKSLEDAGIPKDMVDNYIQGLEAQNTLWENDVKAVAGGDENYGNLLDWGEVNLDDAAIDTFDAAVNSGDFAQAKSAIQGLQAQMQVAEGRAPERKLEGKGDGASDVYGSQAQVEADMNNPLYKTDEAFRQKVYAKMDRSPAI